MLGLTASTRTSIGVSARPVRNGRFTLARVNRCFLLPPPPGPANWPLAPVGRSHGIRGSFNGVRGEAPHFGVDVEALRNEAPVYAIASGTLMRIRPGTHKFSIRSGEDDHRLFYDHVVPVPTLHRGSRVRAGQLIGHVVNLYYHVHLSENSTACGWINAMRPTGPLRIPQNTELPTIGSLHAFVADAAAFRGFDTALDPSKEQDPATPIPLSALHGVVDLRSEVHDWPRRLMTGKPQLELEVAAIRAYLAPLSDRHVHLSRMKTIYDGARLLEPARLGTTLWHIWAFGTWRNSSGYFSTGPGARARLGAAYVWHVGGTRGLHTQLYPDGRYQYCIQALTVNGVRGTRCTAVVIQNRSPE
ncbi:MAG TPA: hypothetical protein VHS27_18260 [Gaiellales bacterium]|nr:hypothetical protein [Gaiellales bacterium]